MIGNTAIPTGEPKPFIAVEHTRAVYLSEHKKTPSYAELSVEAKEFIPFNKITLNIQAAEFTPMSESKDPISLVKKDPELLLQIKEFLPSSPEPENPVIPHTNPPEILLNLVEVPEILAPTPELHNDIVQTTAHNGDAHEDQPISPDITGKHHYTIDEILASYQEFVKIDNFFEIEKRLGDFSHRQVQVSKILHRGSPHKKQKVKKEFLRYEEFKPTENDYWRKAKSAEEEKIHQQAIATTLKLTTSVDDREKIKRKIKITLNKLSPSNIEKLQPELVALAKDSREALFFLVETLFDKSWGEVKYTPMYAQLCKYLKQEFEGHLFEGESPSKKNNNWFRYVLLSCVQTAFDNTSAVPHSPHDPEIHLHLAKKKTHGNIRFIGELLKVRIITAKIIQDIVETLINLQQCSPIDVDEEKIEIACVLVSTAGHFFEKKKLKGETDKIFKFLNEILDQNQKVSSKVKFAIMVRDI